MKNKDLMPGGGPREKMMSCGASAMSEAELLAIVLRTGTSGENVLKLSERILDGAGRSLTELFGYSVERLREIRGIGLCKAVEIQAAFELGRRFYDEKTRCGILPVTSSLDAYERLRPKFKGMLKEECWAMYLNRSGRVISLQKMTTGSSNTTIIPNTEILKRALETRATGVIVAHNHPSGNPYPSEADITQTKRLKEALGLVDISLMDHIVLCDDSYFSFSDEAASSPSSSRT